MAGETSRFKLGRTGQFTTTRWSVILAAADPQNRESATALEELCRCYWQAVYAFVRRRGTTPEDAADLTQGFFAALLEGETLVRADPEKGRFRSFLLGTLKHFLSHEWDRRRAEKRGGKLEFIPLDLALAESRYGVNGTANITPEAQFDRGWALAILDRTLARLHEEFERSGRGPLWEGLKAFLLGDDTDRTYAQAAAELHITEGATKMTVKRMRQRFRALVEDEIAQTTSSAEQLDEELRAFVDAVRG